MKYKIVNHLAPTQEGKSFMLVSIVPDFEMVAGKVVADLNSLWKGIVPLPYRIEISLVPDDSKEGIQLVEDGKIVAEGNGFSEKELFELYGAEMAHFHKDSGCDCPKHWVRT